MNPNNKDHQWFWKKLKEYLKDQELKQTKQRQIIIENFLELGGHVDAESLHDHLKGSHPQIGLATIYRTLTLLKEAGLIEEQDLGRNKAVYEVQVPGDHHDHLVCSQCHKIIEFHNATIEQLQEEIAAEHGFKLTHHQLSLFGLCPNCQKDS